MNNKLTLSLIGLSILVFSYLFVSGQKRFVLWEQVTQHKAFILANKPAYYCDSVVERDLRIAHRFGPIERKENDYQNLYHNCMLNLPQILEDFSPAATSAIEKYSHLIRTKLLYPVIFFSYYFEINMHMVFSFCCLFLILLMSFTLNKVSIYPTLNNFFLVYTFYLLLSLFMNGRMILSFFAFNLLIWICNNKSLKILNSKNLFIYFSVLVPAFIFSNISSSANILMLFFYLLYLSSNRYLLKNTRFVLLNIPILLAHIFFSFISIIKNISFYGNDSSVFVNILNHGLGEQPMAKYLFVIVLLAALFILLKYFHKLVTLDFNLKCALICIPGVFYSYSIFMFSIPFLFFYFRNHKIYQKITLDWMPFLSKGQTN